MYLFEKCFLNKVDIIVMMGEQCIFVHFNVD